MIDTGALKQIILDYRNEIQKYNVVPRSIYLSDFPCYVLVGVRRAGKSFILYQLIQNNLKSGISWDEMLYLNFEDERLENFGTEDFNRILECHAELSDKKPILFFDEMQNVEGWEKFARRLADSKYSVYITGSNANALSKEIMERLGGRYIPKEIYPFSFQEYVSAKGGSLTEEGVSRSTEDKGKLMRAFTEYLHWGGLPESIGLDAKRDYYSSVFQKIYLGDICARNHINNPNLLRLLVKKLAESVMQPVSYTRIANVLSSVGGKISVPTVMSYIGYCEDAWLVLRLRNVVSAFAEKESNCKYYFVDNGILNLLLLESETLLFENLVALQLFRKFGNDRDNERLYFYNEGVEVDFYIPEELTAIQACYSISKNKETFDREVKALQKLPAFKECRERLIITKEDDGVIRDEYGEIRIIPFTEFIRYFCRFDS